MRKDAGFTLLELLVVLVVVSILAMIAIPNFTAMIHHDRAVAAVNELHASLNYTRYAAIIRNQYVVLCKSADGKRCNHTLPDWNSGWLIFENLNRDSNNQVDAGEPILRVHEPYRSKARLISNRDSFTFRPMPLRSVNGTFLYCSEDSRYNLAVIVNVVGRVRIADKPDEDTTLRCP